MADTPVDFTSIINSNTGATVPSTKAFDVSNPVSSQITAISNGQNMDSYVNPWEFDADNGDPSGQNARLLRYQYDDYVNRYSKSEQELMGMSIYGTKDKGAGMINSEIAKGVGTDGYVTGALSASEGQAARQQARYGGALTAEQQQAQANSQAMTRSTATVDAANRIRQRVVDRSNAIATGLSPQK